MVMVKEEVFDLGAEMKDLQVREPEHFLLKIESFSDAKQEMYESEEFEAGGFKWRLVLYPNGDKKRNGINHVSLYLKTCETNNLPCGWEIEANFKLFVYNKILSMYLTFAMESGVRFDWIHTEWGFAQLLPLEYLKETSNGYLFDDTVVFGAEIFVASPAAKMQSLSLKECINTNLFSWTLNRFSALGDDGVLSKSFKIGGVLKLRLYLNNGEKDSKDKCIALYLVCEDDESIKLGKNCKVDAEYTLRVKNYANSDHVETKCRGLFSYSSQGHGLLDFVPLSLVKDESKGFINDDRLVLEVEFTVVNILRNFSDSN